MEIFSRYTQAHRTETNSFSFMRNDALQTPESKIRKPQGGLVCLIDTHGFDCPASSAIFRI